MLKLYKFNDKEKLYWETWDNEDGTHMVHWGTLGTKGNSKTVKSSSSKKATDVIQEEINKLVLQGYCPIDEEDHYVLLIEYEIDGMGKKEDLEKRHRLEDRMNETLGWTGLGACDGGSIGSGTMEVCNLVVDFELAKNIIENDLKNTEFADYKMIYDENA